MRDVTLDLWKIVRSRVVVVMERRESGMDGDVHEESHGHN